MTDQLGLLLEHAADDWCRDARPPGLPGAGMLLADKGRRRRAWAPAFAAAAVVVLVVAPAVLVAQRGPSHPRPLEQVGGPVAVEDGPTVRFRPTDAALPAAANFGLFDPNRPDCTPDDVTAVLDLTDGALHIRPRQLQVCLLPEDLHVTVPAPVGVVRDEQPQVPNPPEFGGRFLHARGVDLNATWTGRCDEIPARGTVAGGDLTVPFTVSGSHAGCGTADPELHVGPAHQAGGPGGVVPADRADLNVSLQLPVEVASGATFQYQITLANPTGHDVALRPCPTFAVMYRSRGGGTGSMGRAPCDQLPESLHSRQQVTLLATQLGSSAGPTKQDSRTPGELTWQIAGAEPAHGTVDVVEAAPKIVDAVPYLAPSGEAPVKSTFRYPPVNGAFPVNLEGPATVHVGEVLRYKVVFVNPAGGPTVPLEPCPTWTEIVAQAPKVTHRPKIIERTGTINCDQAPTRVNPGEQITFEMERPIGSDTPPGAYQVYWQIHNGMTSAPFDLDVLP
jgi:hypothetical protein